jgi:hypothetical protein
MLLLDDMREALKTDKTGKLILARSVLNEQK